MIFITDSGKEIQVPSDYTFMSLEKFVKEIYQRGRADAIEEFGHWLYDEGYDLSCNNIELIIKEFIALKEQKNE